MKEVENGEKLICSVYCRSYLVAVDENGNEYELIDFNESIKREELYYQSLSGTVIFEEEQDQYADGSYARSITEYRYFKPDRLNDEIPNYTKSSGVIDEDFNPLELTR